MSRVAFFIILIAIIVIGGYVILKGKKFGLPAQIMVMSTTMVINVVTMFIYDKMGSDFLSIIWASVATLNALALSETIRTYLLKRAEESSKKIKITSE